MEELEEIRQRLLKLRIKAEKVAEELRQFEKEVLEKIHRRENKKPPPK